MGSPLTHPSSDYTTRPGLYLSWAPPKRTTKAYCPTFEARRNRRQDDGIRDFIAWGFRTGMRKKEIARLTWDMLDRIGSPRVLPSRARSQRIGRVAPWASRAKCGRSWSASSRRGA
jgi:integrase